MRDNSYWKIAIDGLWNNNQALVALLGLCPLLATTTTATNGLGMGMATTAVLVLSNVTISLIRNLVRPEVRLPVFVLVIASFVTAVELAKRGWRVFATMRNLDKAGPLKAALSSECGPAPGMKRQQQPSMNH